ncbi:MAG: YceI family protein [Bacteroidia bacterium]|nr:YceI family protein [Bacteroidia bacterium]
MKLFNNKTLMILLVLFSSYGYMISCTRDNDLIVPVKLTQPFAANRGTASLVPGNLTAGNPNEWKLDKAHSSVLWSTNYVGAAGLLTGRFNQFGMHDVTDAEMQNYITTGQPLKDNSWTFNESDPSKISINGYVQINQSNTGEPGRDAGCNVSGLGTTAIVAGTQNLTVTNLAKIKSTKVELDPESNGYIVTLDLTWQGKLAQPLTKSLVGKLNYVPKSTIATATPYDVFGLQLKFQFNCRDFGITSTSIGDKIDIECNMNFNNK